MLRARVYGRVERVRSEVRAALDRDGYVVVADALDPPSIERLRRAFFAAPTQNDGTQHVRLGPDTPDEAAWRALETHPTVIAAAEHVLGGAVRVRDLHGRNPLPGYGRQGLHADSPARAAGAPYVVVTALWMIDDFTVDNGATRVVPGTHLSSKPIPKPLAQPLARHPDERVIVGRAGSVLILNGHTWHSGTKNESSGPRRAGQMVMNRR